MLTSCVLTAWLAAAWLCLPAHAQIHFVEIDIEQDPEIAQAAGVNGTPTVQVRCACCRSSVGGAGGGPACAEDRACPVAAPCPGWLCVMSSAQLNAASSKKAPVTHQFPACPPARLPVSARLPACLQFFKNKTRVHNVPGVKMKREYKQLIEEHI